MSNPITPADAVLALAQAAVPATTVFDAHLPKSTAGAPLPTRYAVIYPSTPQRTWQDVGHTSDTYRVEWQVTSVATTRAEVEWLAARIRDAFVDVVPTVSGLVCEPIEHIAGQQVRWDDQVPRRVVLYVTDQYGFGATADTA